MDAIAFFGMQGHWEVLIILFLVLLLFGGRKLPELSRALGKSLNEFRKGREDQGEDKSLDESDKEGSDKKS